jgi:hypothetical protein
MRVNRSVQELDLVCLCLLLNSARRNLFMCVWVLFLSCFHLFFASDPHRFKERKQYPRRRREGGCRRDAREQQRAEAGPCMFVLLLNSAIRILFIRFCVLLAARSPLLFTSDPYIFIERQRYRLRRRESGCRRDAREPQRSGAGPCMFVLLLNSARHTFVQLCLVYVFSVHPPLLFTSDPHRFKKLIQQMLILFYFDAFPHRQAMSSLSMPFATLLRASC